MADVHRLRCGSGGGGVVIICQCLQFGHRHLQVVGCGAADDIELSPALVECVTESLHNAAHDVEPRCTVVSGLVGVEHVLTVVRKPVSLLYGHAPEGIPRSLVGHAYLGGEDDAVEGVAGGSECAGEVFRHAVARWQFVLHYLHASQYAEGTHHGQFYLVGRGGPLLGELCLLYISLPIGDGRTVFGVCEGYGARLGCHGDECIERTDVDQSQRAGAYTHGCQHIFVAILLSLEWYGRTCQLHRCAGVGGIVDVHAVECVVDALESATPMYCHILLVITCCYNLSVAVGTEVIL